jgi:hypothetical protein
MIEAQLRFPRGMAVIFCSTGNPPAWLMTNSRPNTRALGSALMLAVRKRAERR